MKFWKIVLSFLLFLALSFMGSLIIAAFEANFLNLVQENQFAFYCIGGGIGILSFMIIDLNIGDD